MEYQERARLTTKETHAVIDFRLSSNLGFNCLALAL